MALDQHYDGASSRPLWFQAAVVPFVQPRKRLAQNRSCPIQASEMAAKVVFRLVHSAA
jgi:hypothetical protein